MPCSYRISQTYDEYMGVEMGKAKQVYDLEKKSMFDYLRSPVCLPSLSAVERIFSGKCHLLFIFYALIICENPWLLLVEPAPLTVKFAC